ncbi:MAG: rhomboid family intramembrane serine protease [Chloroflexi bacterium]|nr:rhomboid family intramembrane serine protease [Chloroflexota bacterium]
MYQTTPPEPPDESVAAESPIHMTLGASGRSPRMTYAIMGVTVVVYLLQWLSENVYGFDLPAGLGIKSNELIAAGQYWRLITPILLHGSLMHIGFNMYALYILGPGLERFYGPWRFLLLYLLGGFAGNVFSMIFTPQPSLGASTAVFGLLAAQGALLYHNRDFFGGERTQRAIINIAVVAGINFLIGLSPGIDNWGHMGGLLGGLVFAWFAGPVLRLEWRGLTPVLVDARSSSQVLLAAVADALIFGSLIFLFS